MYPGGDYQHGEGSQGVPGPPPADYPQSPYPYPQQQPVYPQPTYPQSPPVYQQPPGYQQPQPMYQPPPAYPPPMGYPAPPPRKSQRSPVILVAAVAVVAMLAVVGVAIFVVVKSGKKDNNTNPPVANGSSSPSAGASTGTKKNPEPAEGLTVGTGPVKVDIYVDYGCPPCGNFEQAAGYDLTNYVTQDKITLSIHPVAFIDNASKNQYSSRAAAAAACANDGGKLIEYNKYLLEHQPEEGTAGPENDELISDGRAIGLGNEFASCVNTGAKKSWVTQATSAANGKGVDSVPTVYVNGDKVNATKADVVSAVTSAS
jgi:protein-disulfide isomerase